MVSLRERIEAVLAALPALPNPGMVHDLTTDDQGLVSFTFHLKREDPATLVRDVRRAIQAVQGVSTVRINVVDPGTVAAGPPAATGQRQPPGPAGVPPPPTPREMPHLGRVLAVSSGKGGVGKSTISANLATALARAGLR